MNSKKRQDLERIANARLAASEARTEAQSAAALAAREKAAGTRSAALRADEASTAARVAERADAYLFALIREVGGNPTTFDADYYIQPTART